MRCVIWCSLSSKTIPADPSLTWGAVIAASHSLVLSHRREESQRTPQRELSTHSPLTSPWVSSVQQHFSKKAHFSWHSAGSYEKKRYFSIGFRASPSQFWGDSSIFPGNLANLKLEKCPQPWIWKNAYVSWHFSEGMRRNPIYLGIFLWFLSLVWENNPSKPLFPLYFQEAPIFLAFYGKICEETLCCFVGLHLLSLDLVKPFFCLSGPFSSLSFLSLYIYIYVYAYGCLIEPHFMHFMRA